MLDISTHSHTALKIVGTNFERVRPTGFLTVMRSEGRSVRMQEGLSDSWPGNVFEVKDSEAQESRILPEFSGSDSHVNVQAAKQLLAYFAHPH